MNTQSYQVDAKKMKELTKTEKQVTRLTKSLDKQTTKVNTACDLLEIQKKKLFEFKEELEKNGTYEVKAIECHKLFRMHKREKGEKDEMEKKLKQLEERIEKLQNPENDYESDESTNSDGFERMGMPVGKATIPDSGGKVILIND